MPPDRLAERLAALTALDAPVGFEEPLLRALRDELQRTCDRVETDVRGNLYGWIDGSDPQAPRVMLTAHADEIGFMVTSLTPGGFLRFTKLGQPTDMVLPGQRVRLLTLRGSVEGVIGVKPGHILTAAEARQVPPVSQMYIDVGAASAEEASGWGIEPGTPAVFVGPLTPTAHPGRYFGKCVDNRAGCLCLLEVAERMAKRPPAATVVFAVVVEEEIGLRGAQVAAQRLQPDVVIAVDTVPAGGTPDLGRDELPWEIGGGPLIKVRETRGLSTHRPLRELFLRTAAEQEIPCQLIVDTAGITDATSAQQASADIAAITIGLARRYSHSAVELFDIGDVQAIIDLVAATIPQLTSREQLRRY